MPPKLVLPWPAALCTSGLREDGGGQGITASWISVAYLGIEEFTVMLLFQGTSPHRSAFWDDEPSGAG